MTKGPPTEPPVETINDFQQTRGPFKILSNLARDTKGLIGKPDTFYAKLGGLLTKLCFNTGAGTNIVDRKWAREAQIDIIRRIKLNFVEYLSNHL